MKTTERKSNTLNMSLDDSNKNFGSGDGAARGRDRGRGRGGASGFDPAPGISKTRVNRPAALDPASESIGRDVNRPVPPKTASENLETNSTLLAKKSLMNFIAKVIARGHFSQDILRLLRTEATSHHFMANRIHVFFNEAEKLLVELIDAIDNHSEIDLKKVDKILKKLKTSCLRVGAQKLYNGCVGFINSPDGCRARLGRLRMDYCILKNLKFPLLIDLEESYYARGGTYPL